MRKILLDLAGGAADLIGFALGILTVGAVALLCFKPPFDSIAFIILLCLFFYAIDPDKNLDR